jgi:hypothetical protein
MKKIVAMKLDGGGSLWVEAAEEGPPEQDEAMRSRGARISAETLEEALETARSVSERLVKNLRSLAVPPDKIEASFGLKVSTKLQAILAAGTAEANITFKLVWEKHDQAGRPR